MITNPLISVIVPVYKSARYLRKCLKSLIYQTYPNLEIICINDGSTDNSIDILNEFMSSDSRIIVINKDNEGAAIARNIGIDRAKGDYISFIDSDDWVFLTLYSEFVGYINQAKTNVDIYMFNISSYVKGEHDILPRTLLDLSEWHNHKDAYTVHNFDDCIKPFSHNMSVCNKIYKKSFLKDEGIKFPEGLHYEDACFCIKSCLRSKSILLNPNIFYRYRNVADGSVMSSVSPKVFDIFKIFDIIDEEIDTLGVYETYKYALFQHKYGLYFHLYFNCPEDLKDKYYTEMKTRLIQAEKKNLDPQIYTRLRNSSIYNYLKNSTRSEFENIIVKLRQN